MADTRSIYTYQSDLKPGGLASVQLATDATHHPLVLKLYPVTSVHLSNFHAETTALSLLSHPHIVHMREYMENCSVVSKFGVTHVCNQIVLEYCKYGDVFELVVRTGRMSNELANAYFRQLVDAVEYCHAMNVVHRDLKPENLLIDAKFRLKVADFGSALGQNGNNLERFGTPAYLPQFTAQEASSPSLDLYSCGVILYFLLTRETPFVSADVLNPRYRLFLQNKMAFWASKYYLDSDAKDLIEGLLRADPEERLTISEVRSHPWFCSKSQPWSATQTEMRQRLSHYSQY